MGKLYLCILMAAFPSAALAADPAPTIAVNLTAAELAGIQNMCGVLQIQGVDGMRTVIGIDDKIIAAAKALKEKGGGDDNSRPKP